jgi:hypothetical protein|tara:strand:- start:7587 stop:7823 length:237 start_codon:yes stop_codon:yes gene_type:complete
MNNTNPAPVPAKPKKSTAYSHGLNDLSHTLPIRLLRARPAAVNQFQPIFRQYHVTGQQWRVLQMLTSNLDLPEASLCL